MIKKWTAGSAVALVCAGLVLVPIVEGKGKGNNYSAKDPKGDIARSAPAYLDIVKTSGKKSGKTLVNKVKVKGKLPGDVTKLPTGEYFQLLVTDGGTTSYIPTNYPRDGVKIKRQGKKAFKFILSKSAVGSFKGKSWAVYANPKRGRDDRSPNKNYTYAKYKK